MIGEKFAPAAERSGWFSKNGKGRSLIVLFHGYDSSGERFSSITTQFGERFPDTCYFAPDGPIDAQPGGDVRRWFEVAGAAPDDIYASLADACRQVNSMVDEVQRDLGLGDAETAFVGFSQGASVALHAALTRAGQVAGVLSYAGQTVRAERLETEIANRPEIFLVHGRDDAVVPPERFMATMEFLMNAGIPVKTRMCMGLGHGIDGDGLAHGVEFLAEVLNVKRKSRRKSR